MTQTEFLNLSFSTLRGMEIKKYLHELANLRIEIFREPPYLYDGSYEEEEKYLGRYLLSQESIAILVLSATEIVGAITAIPVKDESSQIMNPLLNGNFDVNEIFYIGECLLKKDFRGGGIGTLLCEQVETIITAMKKYKYITLCTVNRDDQKIDPSASAAAYGLGRKFGYKKFDNLQATLSWKDRDCEKKTDKTLTFWLKEI